MPRRLHRDDYTVGWICALAVELVAAQEMLDEEFDPPFMGPHEKNIYTCGRIGEHLVVIACLPEGRMGTSSAANVANEIRMSFPSVRFGLMVGIGGGVPGDADVRLGDVVVSKPHDVHGGVVQYDFGKATSSGFQRTGSLDGPPTVLLNAVVNLKAKLIRRRGQLLPCLDKFAGLPDFTRMAAGKDILFQIGYAHTGGATCDSCDHEQAVIRGTRTRDLMVHYGTIASGNEVIKNAAIRDQLSAELGGVLCFEMEAAGLMNSFPCLVIRGISDYADSHKNNRWQPYAAATAAAYTKELLCVVPASEFRPSRTTKEITDKSNGQHRSPMTITTAARECLQSLAFPEQEQRFLNVYTAQNTCQWLLNDKQYLDWVQRPRGFFWIKGHPGTGKSVLTKFAVTSYRKSNPHEIVATFFIHGQGTKLQHTMHGLLRALLSSLLKEYPQHLLELTKIFENRNERYGDYTEGRWEWHTSELQEALSGVLGDDTMLRPATLFIDALDECGEEVARGLLSYFEARTKCETAKVKACVSCRHYPILGLDNNPAVYVEERNTDDIEQYVCERLESVSPITQREKLKQIILQKAEGAFQWVLLVTDIMLDGHLSGVRLERLRNKLTSCPGDLSRLYGVMLDSADATERSQMLKLFEWLLFAERPLSAQELREALASDAEMTHTSIAQMREHDSWSDSLDAFERHVKSLSRGLVEFQTRELSDLHDPCEDEWSHEAHLIHQSVADFLLETFLNHRTARELRTFPSTAARGHFQISRSCLNYLNLADVLDDAQMPRIGLVSKFPLALYAVQYTLLHIRKAEKEDMNQDDLPSAVQWNHHIDTAMRTKEDLWKTLDPTCIHMPVGWPFIGASILHVLVACGSRTACSAILNTSVDEVNCLDADGNTPLMLAIREGYQDIALMLLDLPQRSLQCRDEVSVVPLSTALMDINVTNDDEDTALFMALDQKAEAVVEKLIQNGAEVKRLLGREDDLVQLAINSRNKELLDTVAQKHLNVYGAIWFALVHQSPESCKGMLGLIVELLEAGAKITNPQVRDSSDDHILTLASELGLADYVEQIISHTSATIGHLPWQTSLLAAIRQNELETVQTLLHFAPLTIVDNNPLSHPNLILIEALGNVSIFTAILARLYSPDDRFIREIMMIEAIKGDHNEVLSVLLGLPESESGSDNHVTNFEQPAIDSEQSNGESKSLLLHPENTQFSSKVSMPGDELSTRSLYRALHFSVKINNAAATRLLLRVDRISVETCFQGGEQQTPLFIAAQAGYKNIVEMLLTAGAKPSVIDKKGWTPLTRAALEGHCEVVVLLLNKGVAVDEEGGHWVTALGAAASAGKNEIIELLVARGANINKPVKREGSILGIAIRKEKGETVDLLLSKGANLHAKGGLFTNPLGVAAVTGNIQIVERLIIAGADMHEEGTLYANTLGAAVAGGHKDVFDLLLKCGADIHQRGGRYGHALGAAAYYGKYDFVELLLDMGADLSIASRKGHTALYLAACKGHVEVVRLLLERNTDLNARGRTWETLLMEALGSSHVGMVEILLNQVSNMVK